MLFVVTWQIKFASSVLEEFFMTGYKGDSKSSHTLFAKHGEGTTAFVHDKDDLYLERLFGLVCGLNGSNAGPARAQGLLYLSTDSGIYHSGNLLKIRSDFTESAAIIVWQTPDGRLEVESSWSFCQENGIWSRQDRLTNKGSRTETVYSCLARFVLTPGQYDIYSQSSIWCNENQGTWQRLHHGTLDLSCEGARTTQGSTPYMCIRDSGKGTGVVFHVIPKGNWVIRASASTGPSDSLPFAVIELGQADRQLCLKLAPGESVALPQILMQELLQGNLEAGAPRLHKYLLLNWFQNAKKTAPIIFNTWFDDFEFLDIDRLRRQLKAAKETGCEVFTIDAGWYGAGEGDWFSQAGDWREKQNAAFKGRMQDFSEEVRENGLDFGLWMEPERFGPLAPVVGEHPEWFISNGKGYYYLDLANPEAYLYLSGEISRLVDTYKLAWIKLDFNFEPCNDPSGRAFLSYYEQLYRLMDELRAKHSALFVEGCASGGMRLDINALSHYDAHFLTDTVNPIDVLRIYQGALLRLPAGRMTKWAVLRPAGDNIQRYGTPVASSPAAFVTPAGATWDRSVTADADFVAAVALTGVFGFSGDLAGLNQKTLACFRHHVNFYKKWREFIMNAHAHLLTPVRPKEDRSGWVAFQLQKTGAAENLLFVYRLEDTSNREWFKLQALDAGHLYEIRHENRTGIEPVVMSAEQLMVDGVFVELPDKNSAAVIVLNALFNNLPHIVPHVADGSADGPVGPSF
jgi:alpha-galactosidase